MQLYATPWLPKVALVVKDPTKTQETQVPFLGQEGPWRRAWQPIPVFLPGESHGQRSLVGYSPRCRKESDLTERLSTAQHIGTKLALAELNFLLKGSTVE